MQRHLRQVALFGTIILTAAGCSSARAAPPQGRGPAECEAFVLRDTVITVTPAGGTFNLGGVTLTFAAGSVNPATNYAVRRTQTLRGRPAAGFDIRANVGGDTIFSPPVTVEISYRGCPYENGNRPLFMVRYPNAQNGWSPVPGSTQNSTNRSVTAPADGFSSFAIAM